MYTKWTQHLKDPVEKQNFERTIFNSRTALDRLKAMLEEMDSELNRTETDPRYYDTPNWDYRQAHNNGYRQALGIVRKLVDLDQQKETTKQ